MRDSIIHILMAAFVLASILVPSWLIDKAACNRINSNGTRTEYRIIGGCYVEVNDRMIPKDNWRGEYEGSR